jgi:hypothetical protein
MLLLADGQVQRLGEGPLRSQLGESIVKRVQIRAADHLGMQRELVEELALKSEPKAAAFDAFVILAIAAI